MFNQTNGLNCVGIAMALRSHRSNSYFHSYFHIKERSKIVICFLVCCVRAHLLHKFGQWSPSPKWLHILTWMD